VCNATYHNNTTFQRHARGQGPLSGSYDEYLDNESDADDITISKTDVHPPLTTETDDQAVDCAVGKDNIDDEIFENVSNDIDSDGDAGSDIENALPCLEVEHTSNMKTKKRNKVTWAVPACEFSEMLEDKDDEYRSISISRVPPRRRLWIPRRLWARSPQAHVRKHEKDDARLKWKTRHEASRHVEDKSVYNLAQARRSALVMSLEGDVGAGEPPERWPTMIMSNQKFTFGLCNLPSLAKVCENNCYVQASPVCSPYLPAPGIPVVNAVNAVVAAHFDNTRAPDIRIHMPENPGDAPMGAKLGICAGSYQNHGVGGIHAHVCYTYPFKKCT
jgi:hypothetical protein